MSAPSETIDFTILRYTNVWEDPKVLLSAMGSQENARILSVASAGDNVLSLLTLKPALVLGVDLSLTQLYLLELKMKAIELLGRKECAAFLGFEKSTERLDVYQKMKNSLSVQAQEYFDSILPSIELGIVHSGKFEKYFQLFVNKVLPFIHSKRRVKELFLCKDETAQSKFFQAKWNSLRWRLLFKIFFSRFVMGRLGRDPEFLNEVKIPVSRFIMEKAEKQLSSVQCQTNRFLRYQLTGSFDGILPHYLQEGNYSMIKRNLDRIQIFHGSVDQALEEKGTFSGVNLSNIFEYMPFDMFEKTAMALDQGLTKGAKLCYWNLMVPRILSRVNDSFNLDDQLTEQLRLEDDGYFYGGVIAETKK